MRYVQRYYAWLYDGPPTVRADVTRAVVALGAGIAMFIVVSGLTNVLDGQEAADGWADAARTGALWGVLMGLTAAAVIYARRRRRQRVHTVEVDRNDGDGLP